MPKATDALSYILALAAPIKSASNTTSKFEFKTGVRNLLLNYSDAVCNTSKLLYNSQAWTEHSSVLHSRFFQRCAKY